MPLSCLRSRICAKHEKSRSSHAPRFLSASAGETKLPRLSTGKDLLIFFMCVFEPKIMNSVLSGFSFNLFADNHSLTSLKQFLCQLTCVRVRVRVNNFSSKTTRPRDVLFFLKDTLSIEDEKLFKACKSVCSSVC